MATPKTLRDFVLYKGECGAVIRNDHCGGVFRGHVDLFFGGTKDKLPVIKRVLASECKLVSEDQIPFGIN